MLSLLLVFHTALAALLARAREHTQTARPANRRTSSSRTRTERGSLTIEQVLWAGAVIIIVGIVVAAITAYVRSKAGDIQ